MKWIKRIIGFIKLYKDYEYEPETWRHIIETYTRIICNRTRLMSKPTYHYKDIINQIDEWYEKYEQQARDEAIAELEDKISETDWYHLHNGRMVHGANTDNHEAWYKHSDIKKIFDEYDIEYLYK